MSLHPAQTSIRLDLAIFRVILAIALQCLLNCLLHPRTVVLVNTSQKAFDISWERSRSLPVDPLHVFRPPDTATFDVPIPSTDICSLQAEAHSLFALSQSLFNLLDASHVTGDLGCAHNPARRILYRRDCERDQNPLAAFCNSHGFEMFNALPGPQAPQYLNFFRL